MPSWPTCLYQRTGCEFSGAQTLLALGKVEGNRGKRAQCEQKNAWYFAAARRLDMRLTAIFFGPHAPDAQTAQWSVFPHSFKQ
jgi:hypothetical protein